MSTKDPFELWKKTLLMGLGATALTVEKFQEMASELVERGEMTQKEASTFSEDLKERAMKEKEQLESRIKDSVDSTLKSAVKSMGLVSREEFDALKAELDALKKAAKAKSTSAK